MGSIYDMCVDCQSLEMLMDKMVKIDTELSDATRRMTNALQESQSFLAGHQFEKARDITIRTVEIAANISGNINHAIHFLKELEGYTDQYAVCQYKGSVR